jgi:uncharacterized protein YbaR (Trm112 family)
MAARKRNKMRIDHLQYLRCPKTHQPLSLKNEMVVNGKVRKGILHAKSADYQYPIVDFIPRFVPQDNYASNFGLEWNTHAKTQYDEHSGHQLSAERFRDQMAR